MPRILVISDIHANLTALEAVLAEAGSFDSVWCLGDTVGYGPDPNECVERLRDLPNLTCLIGNHDAAALETIELTSFNREARASAKWTQRILKPENDAFLRGLPEKTEVGGVTLAHGSPRSPVWEYVLDVVTAGENMEQFETQQCFIGHTHLPLVFKRVGEGGSVVSGLLRNGETLTLEQRMLLNPGSVGQPRDHDPRAAFAIFNPETRLWKSQRVMYDIEAVQERMRKAVLPDRLVNRLAEGW